MADLAVVILAYNEERHIGRAIASVRDIARDIVVVDSGSTDRTVEIAKSLGAKVLGHPFVNYAQQFQWAMENCGVSAEWFMRLDADEVIGPDLAAEIERKLDTLPPDVSGVNLKRRHIFMGKWIRHGGRYPLVLLRIWRQGKARIEQRWMDEHMLLTEGRSVTFDGAFSDINLHDLTYFTSKHNQYATREAIDILYQKYDLGQRDAAPTSAQAKLKRLIKEEFYNRSPFQTGPIAYFIYRYFFQFGFLDGKEGLVYHFLQGYWYRFLVSSKVFEYERELRAAGDIGEKRQRLSRLTGYELAS